MNIGVVGVGGVGGYFGGMICRHAPARGDRVHFLARGKHLEEIRRNGLLVSTSGEGEWTCEPTLATDRIEEFPVLDVCLLCVKSFDLEQVMAGLHDRVSDSTLIVPLLNGVDVYERVREELTVGHVLPACVYVGTHIERYGKVVQKGGASRILLGKDPRSPDLVPTALFELFESAGIRYEWLDDAYPEIWGKFVFIAAFGLVTASQNMTLGQILESEQLSRGVLSLMEEIVKIGRKSGIDLPQTLVEDSYAKARNFPYDTKTSFQRDFERTDKPDERDLFAGTILRLGKRLGIDTPVTREILDILDRQKPAAS